MDPIHETEGPGGGPGGNAYTVAREPLPVIVRLMAPSDIFALTAAFADMRKTQLQYEHCWKENQSGVRLTLVAQCLNAIVGYASIVWTPGHEDFIRRDIPVIHDMNVATALRGRGVGRRLIAEAERIVRKKGHRFVGIGVGLTPDYDHAKRLYPRLGFVPDGTGAHPDAWGGCMYMVKVLA